MADQLDKGTIDALAAAIGQALKTQGRAAYDQSNWGEKRTPAQRAADMKKADQASKSMNATFTKLTKAQITQGKSADELIQALKDASSANKKTMDMFGHNFEKAEKSFVKALNDALNKDTNSSKQLRDLVGTVEKMEDVFRFDDLTRTLAELNKGLDDSKTHQTSAKATYERLIEVYRNIDKKGMKLEGVDPLLKDFDKLINHLTTLDKKSGERTLRNDKKADVGKTVQDWLKTNKVSADAQNRMKEISAEGVATAAQKTEKALGSQVGLWQAAGVRVKDFAEKTFTAANALTMLEHAAVQLYKTTKESYATGTEKSFTSVLGRDISSAIIHGVNPAVMQEAQVKNAGVRNTMGRDAFDSSLYRGADELNHITGDRDSALTLRGSLDSSLAHLGVSFGSTDKAVKALSIQFAGLQQLTGMNAEQFGELTNQLTSDTDIRAQMANLTDRERVLQIASIENRIRENKLMGFSIEQSKQQISILNKMFDPRKPIDRAQNAAKQIAFFGAQGMNSDQAYRLGTMGRMGDPNGSGAYRKQLVAQIGEKAADAQIKGDLEARQGIIDKTRNALVAGGTEGMTAQALVQATGQESLMDDAFNGGNKATPDAKKAADKTVSDEAKGTSNLTGSIFSLGDRISALSHSVVAMTVAAGVIALVVKNFGLVGMLTGGAKSLLSKGAAAAATGGVAGVAGAAAKGVTGLASTAAGAVGTAGAAAKGLSGLKLAKGLSKGIPGLALLGAQALTPEDSTAGKILNSNTVNGAAWGATIGSIVPVLGTGVGAAIGGGLGATKDLWDYYHPSPADPTADTSFSVAGTVAPDTPTSAPLPSSYGPITPTPGSNPPPIPRGGIPPLPLGVNPAPSDTIGNAATLSELQKQNQYLQQILAALKDQTNTQDTNSNKSLDMFDKLKRALSKGATDTDLVAASKYN